MSKIALTFLALAAASSAFGAPADREADIINNIVSSQVLAATNVSAQSAAAPSFSGREGFVFIEGLEGVTQVMVGNYVADPLAPVATQLNSLRIEAGQRRVIRIREGQKVAAIESTVGMRGAITNPASAPFARPADTTAYAIGDLVANNTVAGNVVAGVIVVGRNVGCSVKARRARLFKSGTGVTNAAFSCAGAADYLGSIDIASMQAFTDGAVGYGAATLDEQIDLAADKDSLFYLIEARGAYAGGSAETFAVGLEIEQV